jgi:hypothetical protein
MTCSVTRRAALAGISLGIALPARAQTPPARKGNTDGEEFAVLEQPAAFEVASSSGSLKETVQKGQELIWHRREQSSDRRFQLSNIAIALLRTETGGQVKLTFSGNVSSLGYRTSTEAQLNVILRSKGGASLYAWNLGISVNCGDNNQPLTPLTHELPRDIAANIFTSIATIDVAERSEPNSPGVSVRRCG